MRDGGHFFLDTALGDLMVGQAEEMSDGTWSVEVNDEWVEAPDLGAAKRLFVESLRPSQGQSPTWAGIGAGGRCLPGGLHHRPATGSRRGKCHPFG